MKSSKVSWEANNKAKLIKTFNEYGFGINEAPNARCSGCFSFGVGTAHVYAEPRPWWGVDLFVKLAADGIARLHVRHSDGSIVCLTCPPAQP